MVQIDNKLFIDKQNLNCPLKYYYYKILFILFIFSLSYNALCQTKKINIINADELSFDKTKVDAQKLIGHVILKHSGAIMYCDSAYLYTKNNSFTAYSKIKIIQGDSLEVFGDTLFYKGDEKTANIIGNVIFKEKDLTLNSSNLFYNLNTNIASYNNGARIVSSANSNTLSSISGRYNSNIETLFFKDSVTLLNPNYIMKADTLVYRVSDEVAYFHGNSKITSKETEIKCNNGWYDTKNEKSSFWNKAIIKSEREMLSGDSIFYNEKDGFGEAFGNIKLFDSLNNMIIYGGYGYYNELKDSTYIDNMPILQQKYDDDTLYISADKFINITDSNNLHFLRAYNNVKFYKQGLVGICDSISYIQKDSSMKLFNSPILWNDENQISGKYMELRLWDGKLKQLNIRANSFIISKQDSINFNQISGNDLIGIFTNNSLDTIKIYGNINTIYYISNSESEPASDFNKSSSKKLIITLDSSKIKQLQYIDQIESSMSPIENSKIENRTLDTFNWQILKKPKIEFFIKRRTKKEL